MPKRTLTYAVDREKMRSIKLRQFFRTLVLTIGDDSEDPFEVLGILRDKGLKLTAAQDGYFGDDHPIHAGVITAALVRVKKAYRKAEAEESSNSHLWSATAEIWNQEVSVRVGERGHEYKVSIGELWVEENDYATVCQRLGLESYFWPKVSWPESLADLEERTLDYPCRNDHQSDAISRKLSENVIKRGNAEKPDAHQIEISSEEPKTETWRNDPNLLKGNKQERAVSAVIAMKGWNPLMIPDGEKSTIETICQNEYPELFAAQYAFQETWKRGLGADPPKWRMQSHASYAKRGKQ